MRPKLALVLGLACLAGPAIAGSPPAAEPSIVAVFPNPVADGDAGEYVVLDVAGSAGENLTLSDGEQTVAVPSIETEQRLVLTGSADAVPSIVDGRIVELPEWPELANGGERLVLSRNDRTLDAVRYEDAPEGERGTPGPTGLTWEPLGATDLDPLAGGPARLRAFTLPDAPGVPIETLRGADRRLLLAGYTLTSRRVADALVEAADRGVDVAVLVDAAPVGGLTNRSAAILDRLAATNVTVNVVGGETSPYRFHHAKYAVVDDRAVVLTENWKPAGTGGRSSRGWGVVVEERSVVDGLRETFRADSRDRTAVPWERFRANATLEPARPTRGSYPRRFEPESVNASRVELLVAPDNAAGRVESVLDNASESVRIVQVSVDGPDNRLLAASIDAARRGVTVRLLLSRAWYTAEENRALARNVSALAEQEGIDLRVRLAEPNGRFEKIHAKGVLVDGEHVVLGSLNWNDNAFENNREVALVLTGEAVADYYDAVFEADWKGGIWELSVGLLVVLVGVVLAAVAVGRRIDFRPE